MTRIKALTCLLWLPLLLLACDGAVQPTPTATLTPPLTPQADISGIAPVDTVELTLTADGTLIISFKGNLPDGCTLIDEISDQQNGNTFFISVTTLRPGGLACTEAVVPFEQIVRLAMTAQPPGTYAVDVNGVSAIFEIEAEPTPTPTVAPSQTPRPTPTIVSGEGTGAIQGRLVHDICALGGGEGGEPLVVGDGCIDDGANGFIADGALALSEPGIEGIVIDLGGGACPATGLASTTTNETGRYAFNDLPEGVYCVSIEVGQGKNEGLIPGRWTAPELDSGIATITVFPNTAVTAVDFGWDYQFLPIYDVNEPGCFNALFFVEDLTIPDDTEIQPGESFVKTWRLQNSGSCIWTTAYLVRFAGGTQMTLDSEFFLPEVVPAGAFIDISLTLIAPPDEGPYRAEFMLVDDDGVPFGSGGNESDVFWVQIVVDADATQPEPNSASINGTVWADDNANGIVDSFEAVLPGVEIRLSDQACPDDGIIDDSHVVAATNSDDDGIYSFDNLPAGTYCVSIAPFSTTNVELLIPGDWTYPAQGVGYFTLILNDGVTVEDLNFGWRFQ